MEKVAVVWALAGPRREQDREVKHRPMHHIIKLFNSLQEAKKFMDKIEQRAKDLNIQNKWVMGGVGLWIPGEHSIDIYYKRVQVGSMYEAIFS